MPSLILGALGIIVAIVLYFSWGSNPEDKSIAEATKISEESTSR